MTDEPESVAQPGPDLGALFQQAQQMQEQMAAAADVVVEGQAGGGAVKVEVDGSFDFKSVHIDSSAIDPDDPEMLQDLVLAALHDAVARLGEVQQQSMSGFDLGGLDLGGLLGSGE
jgi:hypothetical protein